MSPPFVSEALTERHDLAQFDCGKPQLNDWLRKSALHARETWGPLEPSSGLTPTSAVAAYYSLAPHLVERQALPTSVARGSPDQIPAILLARLALDHSLHGQRMGSQLLLDALELIVISARKVGGRLVLVDAIDAEAVNFYRHHGFESVSENENRLVQKLSRVAATLQLTWP